MSSQNINTNDSGRIPCRGLTAAEVCLPGESHEQYEKLRQQHIDLYRPADFVERDTLDFYVAALWQKNRFVRLEAALIGYARRRAEQQDVADRPFMSQAELESAIRTLRHCQRHATRQARSCWDMFKTLVAPRVHPQYAQPLVPAAPGKSASKRRDSK